MLTQVVFARKDKNALIAYINTKHQHVFLEVVRADIAPTIENILITDNGQDINSVIENNFGYKIEKKENINIGIKIKHIWKPLLTGDFGQELDYTIYDLCKAKRDLAVLIQKLQEVLLYVEPSKICLDTYSHKLRELLILACTDFECSMKSYNFGNNERTSDYIKILELTDLKKYKVELAGYSEKFESRPFLKWDCKEPTKSLPWYDAYNNTKHNRTDAFHLATLKNCIDSISANIIMFCIRYSPQSLYNESDVCSNLVRNTFALQIEDASDIYIPIIEGERSYSGAFTRSINFKNGTVLDNIYDKLIFLPFIENNGDKNE